MIYYSPYDTTIGKAINIKEAERNIRTALVKREPYIKVNDKSGTITVNPNTEVPKFEHPIPMKIGASNFTYSAVDMSAFVRTNSLGEVTVANSALYNIQTIRAGLTSHMYNQGARGIRALDKNVIRTYSDLITNALSTSFGLDSDAILTLRVLSAWFYVSLLHEEEGWGEMEFHAQVARVSRDIGVPAIYIERYVDQFTIDSVDEFIEKIKTHVSHRNIQKLNVGLFYTIVAKNILSVGWVGINKEETVAIAIEHIPTFIALIVSAITEPAFKHAGLTKLVLRNFSRDTSAFLLSVDSLVNSQ